MRASWETPNNYGGGLLPGLVSAFGPEETIHVTERGVRLSCPDNPATDAIWLEGGPLRGPSISHWRPSQGEVLTFTEGGVQVQYSGITELVKPNDQPVCSNKPPSWRFGWSDTILLGDGLVVESISPDTGSHCRSLSVRKQQTANATFELCTGDAPFGYAVGDALRIELKDIPPSGEGARTRVLRIDRTPAGSAPGAGDTTWLVRGNTRGLETALPDLEFTSMYLSPVLDCPVTDADGCGVGGIPLELRLAPKPGNRSFNLQAGESVRGNFASVPIEIRVVRASYRPFRSADCTTDPFDIGLLVSAPLSSHTKATIAR